LTTDRIYAGESIPPPRQGMCALSPPRAHRTPGRHTTGGLARIFVQPRGLAG